MAHRKIDDTFCVIFDLDGTLVDSERLGNRAFLDLLPELDVTLETLIACYRGKKLTLIFDDLESRLGQKLPDDFETHYRAHVAKLFAQELKVMPGTYAMLEALRYPCCIASSGPLSKIRNSLEVTGLKAHFDDRIFSAYEVGSWKPEPDLFLFAARKMGFQPVDCIVIEDSQVGIEAAHAAGMRALHYLPEANNGENQLCKTFSHMEELAAILDEMLSDKA